MAMHRYHPDPGRDDDPDAILYDDCERCAQHAHNLVSLDAHNIRALFERMRDVEYGSGSAHYLTVNEAIACRNIQTAQRVMQVITREGILNE